MHVVQSKHAIDAKMIASMKAINLQKESMVLILHSMN
jgi:hypothetical protein